MSSKIKNLAVVVTIEDKVDTKELVSKYNDLLDLVRKLEEQYGKGTND